MKIQFICNYSALYGANRSLLSIIEHLHKKGYKINVLLPSKGSFAEKLFKLGIEYNVIPYYSQWFYFKFRLRYIVKPLLFLFNLMVFPMILYSVKRNKPDLIYSNTSAENIGIFISKILNIKHVLHVREFMSLDYNAKFLFGLKAKAKFINWSEGVIFVSNSIKQHLYGDADTNKKHKVIYNGICQSNSKSRSISSSSVLRFGLVGIFDKAKGHIEALKYFMMLLKEFPNSELHFYGDKKGSYKYQIEKFVKLNNLERNVFFHGFVNDINCIYSGFDILLMFSKSEGFGRVTVEAMNRGIPVIGYNNAGTSEIIEDRLDGCLFDSYPQFLDALSFTLNNYDSISAAAIKSTKEKFNEEIYVEKVEVFVKSIIEGD